MKTLILSVLFTAIYVVSLSQISFERNYGQTGVNEESSDVVQTTDNGYMLVYNSNGDVSLLRTNENGVELWTKTIFTADNYYANSISLTSDNGFIIAGYCGEYDVNRDIFLIRADSNGDTLWTTTLGGSNRENVYRARQTPDGGFAVAGYIDVTDTNSDGFIIKTDNLGNELWTQYYGSTGYDYFYDFELTSDNGFIIAGHTTGFGTGGNAWVVKANSLGVQQWHTYYSHPGGSINFYLFGVDVTSDNNYVFSGLGGGIHTMKMNSLGDTLWTRKYGDWQYYGNDIASTDDGGYVSLATKSVYTPEGYYAVLVKYDASGNEMWAREVGLTNSVLGSRIKLADDNGFYVCGRYDYNGEYGSIDHTNSYLLKTDENGDGCINYLNELQEICMVSIDNATGFNKIVWEPSALAPAESYNVYKEGTEGYFVIGNVPVSSLSEFIDTSSNPGTHSDKYKLSILDTCGIETEMGDFHKTIHLNVSPATPTGFALTWDHYDGFVFSKYRIFRGTSSSNLVQIDSIISSNFTYTDETTLTGALYYQVAAVKPSSCFSSSSAKDVGGPYSQSVSNLDDNGLGESVDEVDGNKDAFVVFPNPTSGNANICFRINESSDVAITLVNLLGEELFVVNLTHLLPGKHLQELSVKDLPAGLYVVHAKINNVIFSKQLVISK